VPVFESTDIAPLHGLDEIQHCSVSFSTSIMMTLRAADKKSLMGRFLWPHEIGLVTLSQETGLDGGWSSLCLLSVPKIFAVKEQWST